MKPMQRADSVRASMRRTAARIDAERAVMIRAHVAASRAAESARVRFTAEDLRGAVMVEDRHGWHRVIRVNAKTVTVASLAERIALAKILDYRPKRRPTS